MSRELIDAYVAHQMPGDLLVIGSAAPAIYFAVPPYAPETFKSGLACVLNANGINCLTFRDAPGRVLTAPHIAHVIARQWNNDAARKE